jgi:hypothetical protein
MKPAAAFAAGLWTGAVVMAAVGAFYLRVWELGRSGSGSQGREKLETRIQLLQQDQTRALAEEARLKQTIADLQTELETRAAMEARREFRVARREAYTTEAPVDPAIVDAVVKGDVQALPRLEQAALQNNLPALDALALLADRDGGESLNRVWNASNLSSAGRERATFLLAATLEVNLRAEDLLHSVFANPPADRRLQEAALAGIEKPDFPTKLRQTDDFPAPPHFQPDYGQRLWVVESWRTVVTDEQLLVVLDQVRARLAQHVAGERRAE